MDTNYEFLEEVELNVASNDASNDVNLTELEEVNISPHMSDDEMDREEEGQSVLNQERQRMILDRHLRFYPMSLVTYEQLTAMDPIANRLKKSKSKSRPEPILRSRPMTRGYARQLYQEAHPEERETSDSDSDSEDESEDEIVFGKPYKMTVYESALVDFVIKPIAILWICMLCNCILFLYVKTDGPRTGNYETTRPSLYQMNVPNQMCGMEL